MAERKNPDDVKADYTISHNLDDTLEATIGERAEAEKERAAQSPRPGRPGAPERIRSSGNTDAPAGRGTEGEGI